MTNGNTFNADNEMTAFNGTALTGACPERSRRDGLNPVAEMDGASPPNPTATMLTGLNIDEYFQRVDSNGALSYLTDMLDSTLALADSSGALDTAYTYDPFGNVTVNGADTNPYQFTGRENDGTGLYYYRARYYSPTFQRFVSQDPIGFAGGNSDLYSYANGNPISLSDARGLETGWVSFYSSPPHNGKVPPPEQLNLTQCDKEIGCDACAILACTGAGAAAGVNSGVDLGCAAVVVSKCHQTFQCGGEGPTPPQVSTKFPPLPPPPPRAQPEPEL